MNAHAHQETTNPHNNLTAGKAKVFNINSAKSYADLVTFFEFREKKTQQWRYNEPLTGQMTTDYIDENGLNETHWMNFLVWVIETWIFSRGREDEAKRLAIVMNTIRNGEYARKNNKFEEFSGHDDVVMVTIPPFKGRGGANE